MTELRIWLAVPILAFALLYALNIFATKNNADMGALPSIFLGAAFCIVYSTAAFFRLAFRLAFRHH